MCEKELNVANTDFVHAAVLRNRFTSLNLEPTCNYKNVPDAKVTVYSDDGDRYISLNASSLSSHSKDSDNSKENVSGSPPGSKGGSCETVTSSNRLARETMSLPDETKPRCPCCGLAFESSEHEELLKHIESCCN